MKTWPSFKQETLQKDRQPFMAWGNGEPKFQAQYDPSSGRNFIDWLRHQELLAKRSGASFACYTMLSGKHESTYL